MVRTVSEMMVLRLVRTCVKTNNFQPSPKYFACHLRASSRHFFFGAFRNILASRKKNHPRFDPFPSDNIILLINNQLFYSCHQSAGKRNMRLSRQKFHFRGICIRIFSFCTWFIHEREQSNQMRKSPEWELHVCLKVLWLDPFPDIFLLGCCTGVSDKHRSAPLPSDAGHQSVAPVLLPSLSAQSLCMNLHKHISGEQGWHSSQSWTNTQSHLNARCFGMILQQQSLHLLPGPKQNDTR